ncbi:MAG: beta-lactamase family protein [Cyclobacteriaceae bacterium]|nr:beta-lactamase family protein [Cyclobacteriaceae bacterium]
MQKLIFRSLIIILLGALTYGIYYAWLAFPIITGYGAKILCSCTMLVGRSESDVISNELSAGLLTLGSYRADYSDSSATATVFGLAKRKAIYRKGLGCTLINEIKEEELRNQPWVVASVPKIDQDTIPWPAGNQLPDYLDLTPYDINKIQQTINEAFAEPGEENSRRTRAIVVVHDGKIIAEKYASGFTSKTRQMGWSMTKSLTNGIIGLLVREQKISLNDHPPIKAWQQDERATVLLHHLMQASSGLEWEEIYSGPSTATTMLFKKRDAGSYAAAFPLKNTPGEVFYYSSGTTNILSKISRQLIGDTEYHSYPYHHLFYKIGMHSLVIEPDPDGTFVGSSFSYATARDWARFGLLYLNDGYWMNERILPEGWVEYTATPAKGAKRGEYGAQFWLNAGNADNPSDRHFPDVPADMLYCSGYEDQYVFIIPSKNLVVVRLGLTTGNGVDYNQFLKHIIDALPE